MRTLLSNHNQFCTYYYVGENNHLSSYTGLLLFIVRNSTQEKKIKSVFKLLIIFKTHRNKLKQQDGELKLKLY